MKKIVKFNTSYGTKNMGDFIINDSVNNEMSYLFENNFVVEYGTHTPVTHFYQCMNKSGVMSFCNKADYKFIGGTNLLSNNMFRPWPNWNVNIFNYAPYKGSILIGCGLNGNFKKVNFYTKCLYKRILSKEYIHSVRDDKTKAILENLGFKAINTGCATLWSLTSDFCRQIKKEKSENVIFTLTDYCKDYDKDQELINILLKEYKNVYFWVQGSEDYDYIKTFKEFNKIKIVNSNLASYQNILMNGNVDYIGTRLHAGIYAMKHKVRSIIIAIDNRTKDMSETYNLVTVERNNINQISSMINRAFETKININEDNINKWKNQFK